MDNRWLKRFFSIFVVAVVLLQFSYPLLSISNFGIGQTIVSHAQVRDRRYIVGGGGEKNTNNNSEKTGEAPSVDFYYDSDLAHLEQTTKVDRLVRLDGGRLKGLPKLLVKEGYFFRGWLDENNRSYKEEELTDETLRRVKSLRADIVKKDAAKEEGASLLGKSGFRSILKPTIKTRTYKFHNREDGSDPAFYQQIIKSGELLYRPDDPEPIENKVFRGWKFKKDGTNLELPQQIVWNNRDEDPENEDIDLVPRFESRYTITYLVEGQVWRVDNHDPKKIKVIEGITPPTEEIAKKRWDGLSYDVEVDGMTFPSPHIRNGKEYFAYWMEQGKFEEWKKILGRAPEEDDVYPAGTANAGQRIRKVAGNEFRRKDWKEHLRNIKNAEESTDPAVKDAAIKALEKKDAIRLMAVTGKKTEVFFDSQGGSAVRPLYIRYEQSINEGCRDYFEDFKGFIAYPRPKRKGYRFIGWSTKPGIIADRDKDYSDAGSLAEKENVSKYPELHLKSWGDKVEEQVILYAVWQPMETVYSISLWLEDTNQWREGATEPPFQKTDSKDMTFTYYKFIPPSKIDPDTGYPVRAAGDPPEVHSGERIDPDVLEEFLKTTNIPSDQKLPGAKDGTYLDDIESALGRKFSDVYYVARDYDDPNGNAGLYERIKGDGTTDLQVHLRRKPHEYSARYFRYKKSDQGKESYEGLNGDIFLETTIPHGYTDNKILDYLQNYIGDKDHPNGHYKDYYRGVYKTGDGGSGDNVNNHYYARYPINRDANGVDKNIWRGFIKWTYETLSDVPSGESWQASPKAGQFISDYSEITEPTTMYIRPNPGEMVKLAVLYVETEEGRTPTSEEISDYKNIEIDENGNIVQKGKKKVIRPTYICDANRHENWKYTLSDEVIPGFYPKPSWPKYQDYGSEEKILDKSQGGNGEQVPIKFAFVYYVRRTYKLTFSPKAGIEGHPDFSGNRKFEAPIYVPPGQAGSDESLNKNLAKYVPRKVDSTGKVIQEGTIINRNGVRYEFTGWYLSPETRENTKVDLEKLGKMPPNDMTLYGGWRPKEVRVRVFKDDDNQDVNIDNRDDNDKNFYDIYVPYDTAVKEANPLTHVYDPNHPDMVGHGGDPEQAKQFKWWFWIPRPKQYDKDGKWTGEGDGYEEPYVFDYSVTYARKLFPRWFYHDVHIVYDANGGKNEAPKDTLRYSFKSKAVLVGRGKLEPPEGKVFAGWSIDKDPINSDGKIKEGKNVYAENSLLSITEDTVGKPTKIPASATDREHYQVKLYAVWGKMPEPTKLTYHENGMSGQEREYVVDKKTVLGKEVLLPENSRLNVLDFTDPGPDKFINNEYDGDYGCRFWSVEKGPGVLSEDKVYVPGERVLLDNKGMIKNGNKTVHPNHLYARYCKFEINKTCDKEYFRKLGDPLTYTVSIKNTGNISWESANERFKLHDTAIERAKKAGVDIDIKIGDPNSNGILDAGETWTFTYTYKAMSEDVEKDRADNEASFIFRLNPNKTIETGKVSTSTPLATSVDVEKSWTGEGDKPDKLNFILYEGDKPLNVWSLTSDEISQENISHSFTTKKVPDGAGGLKEEVLLMRDGAGEVIKYRLVETTKDIPEGIYEVGDPKKDLKDIQTNDITPGMNKEVGEASLVKLEEDSKLSEKKWLVRVRNHFLSLPDTGALLRDGKYLIGFLLLGLGIGLYIIKSRKKE